MNQISKQLLIQYFYEGLLPMDRNVVDAASGGLWSIRLSLRLEPCLIICPKSFKLLKLGKPNLGKLSSMRLVWVHL